MNGEQGLGEEQRLRSMYRDLGDGELLELGERPGDLTSAAREALRSELSQRGLDVRTPVDVEVLDGEAGMPTAADLMPSNLGATGPEMELTVLYDAMMAGRACEFLEQAAIPFHVADLTDKSGLGTLEGGPAVALRLTVPLTDLERARGVLRKHMGLFPLQEVETGDEAVDDGTRTAVGYFATTAEAEEVAVILSRAGFANWVVENAEGSAEEENLLSVEVREVDVFAAGEAVDQALGVGE